MTRLKNNNNKKPNRTEPFVPYLFFAKKEKCLQINGMFKVLTWLTQLNLSVWSTCEKCRLYVAGLDRGEGLFKQSSINSKGSAGACRGWCWALGMKNRL